MKKKLDNYFQKQYSEHIQEPEPEVNHETINCYEIGKKFGRCGTQVLFDMPFNDEDDIVIPKECAFLPETKRGINDGVKEVFEMATELQKKMLSAVLEPKPLKE